MIEPSIINVICPSCGLTWLTPAEWIKEYFCCACNYSCSEGEAKKEAWRSESIYYGE
jgi:hypothetical protein